MKVVVIVQARMKSTRLPAKVLLDLGGATALQRCLDRALRIEGIDNVVVATSTDSEDNIIERVAHRLGYGVFRGSERDVLSRYHLAAHSMKADVIVRCTSDCPLLDPVLSSKVVCALIDSRGTSQPFDYVSNVVERRLPRGLDTEVFTIEALDRAHQEATEASEREHVTAYLYRRPQMFRCGSVVSPELPDLSSHRWTLDTLEDYVFLSSLFESFGPSIAQAPTQAIVAFLQERPDLICLNAHVAQKPVA